ncbi:MAG TPA: hypothetical protein VFM15_01645 [Gammaproteobacteria bacterium]|nr:hypothetical protein [Gammaproteobacteria bacterium]
MIRILTGMILMLMALCATFGGLLWYERGRMGERDCEISVAAQTNADTQHVADVQHQADKSQLQQLRAQIAKLQADADAAAHLRSTLETRLAKQTEVLRHVHDTDIEARRCLDASVPHSLLDSLRAAAGVVTGAPGESGGI